MEKVSGTKNYWLEVADKLKKCRGDKDRLKLIFELLDEKRAFRYEWIAKANTNELNEAIKELKL